MAKKGKPKADNDNKTPIPGGDTAEGVTTEAPRGKKQKKTYN